MVVFGFINLDDLCSQLIRISESLLYTEIPRRVQEDSITIQHYGLMVYNAMHLILFRVLLNDSLIIWTV
jgi:hypothetical protein